MYKKILQFIKFGFVGLSNNLIFFAIYYTLIYFNVNYLESNILSYVISSIWGYVLNRIWVFKENKEKVSKTVVKYYIIYGSSFFINVLSMYIVVDILDFSKIIAPVLTMIIVVPYNFILNKIWTFKS